MTTENIKALKGFLPRNNTIPSADAHLMQQYGKVLANSMGSPENGYGSQVMQAMYGYRQVVPLQVSANSHSKINPLQNQTRQVQLKEKEEKATQESASGEKLLTIGSADDYYEKEADAVADQVISMPQPAVQRKCAHCEAEENLLQRKKIDISPAIIHKPAIAQRKCTACEAEEKPLQRKSVCSGITPHIQAKRTEGGVANEEISTQIQASKGSTMQDTTRSFMESRFAADFSGVKIHTDTQAIQLSRQLNAQAFATGNDIYFNQGKYSPESLDGKHLLAHELTHVVQQSASKNVLSKKENENKDNKETLIAKWYGNLNETLYHFIIPVCNTKEEAAQIVAQILRNDSFIYFLKSGDVATRKFFESETNQSKSNTIFINDDAFKVISAATGKSREDFIRAINTYQKYEQLEKQGNEMARTLDIPYKNSWLDSFLEGAAGSALKEKAPEAWARIKSNATSWETGPHFYSGVIVGYPEGVVEDLWENIKGIVLLAWQLIKANYELQTDPIGFYKKIKQEVSGLWQILETDPKALGNLAGNALADKINKEFINVSAFEQGFHLGEMVGMVVTEIALLFVGVEEVLALAKVAEGTKIGSLIAKGLRESETLGKAKKFLSGEKVTKAVQEASEGITELQKLRESVRLAQEAAKEGKPVESLIHLEERLLKEEIKNGEKVTQLTKQDSKALEGFTAKVEVGGHEYYRKKNGGWCRFSPPPATWCGVLDPDIDRALESRLKTEGGKDIGTDRIDARAIHSEEIGVQQGKKMAVEQEKLKDLQIPNLKYEKGNQGFDDIMEAANGDWYILEYKGGTAELAEGQMERAWVVKNIDNIEKQGWKAMADKLRDKLNNGKLKGIAYSTPINEAGVPLETKVIKRWTY